ncbi:MAG: EF-P lysine aminoacylase EpmA [Gammaproteobacteria bacterium]|nr:EF-P lysine aminoacylase EpmA [Gammaproteobacteria bacterium]
MEKDNWPPVASLELMKKRARMLHDIRAFFHTRDVLEVETPLLASAGTTDPHIESLQTVFAEKRYYLQTSPEHAMKRLLAEHSAAIFQLCKVFRDEELGPMHNPEFSMLEWYRPGFDMHQLMAEVEALASALASTLAGSDLKPFIRLSYRQAFEQYAGLNPHQADAGDCRECALQHGIEQPVGLDEQKDEWLDWLLTQLIFPALPIDQFTFIYDYPVSQCALARLKDNEQGELVASRFELFYGDTELANGFHELTQAGEQRRRFEADNVARAAENKPQVKIDEYLLAALESGLPDCSGVALGLDRLLMALSGETSIDQVLTFPWARI